MEGHRGREVAKKSGVRLLACSRQRNTKGERWRATQISSALRARFLTPEFRNVHATAADLSLRYVDLNRRINHDYGFFGGRFQAIIDSSWNNTRVSDAYPGWFAFAAFASRAIGQAELGAEIALNAARFYRETGDHKAALEKFVSPDLVPVGARLIEGLVDEQARLAATFLVAFASALRRRGAFQGVAFPALLDPRTFTVSLHRLLELLTEAPGSDPIERIASVSLTLRNMMENGNRRIYGDICGAGQDYLHFRESRKGSVTPEQVLNEFALCNRPDLAKTAYDYALQHLRDTSPPLDFEQVFPAMIGDARPLVVAAFALYEQAGQTPDLEEKNLRVAFANNFVIYREQREALQPAFTPGAVLPGEVGRLKLLAIITPESRLSCAWRHGRSRNTLNATCPPEACICCSRVRPSTTGDCSPTAGCPSSTRLDRATGIHEPCGPRPTPMPMKESERVNGDEVR